MSSIHISLIILGISILYSFFAGLINRNYSYVDRLWSLLPPLYVLVWMGDFAGNPRYMIAAILVILWGVRLTANFAVKGGYAFSWKKGFYGEDYRWDVLRKRIPNRVLFELFNFAFISTFQLVLIFAFTLPLYFLGRYTAPLGPVDFILFGLHFLFLLLETIADIQQLHYYRKRSDQTMKGNRRVQLGFNTFGLWKYSRHPNYVCEISQWFIVYLYLHHMKGLDITLAGPVVLLVLFIGSTIMAESITASKYSEYGRWQKMTAPWIPFLFRLPERKAKKNLLEE